MDEIQRELIKAGRKDLAQEYYKKIAGKRTVIEKVKSKHGDLEIEVIEDTVLPSGDAGHLLNFKIKKPLQVTIAKGLEWPDLKAEKEAIALAKKIVQAIDKAIGR